MISLTSFSSKLLCFALALWGCTLAGCSGLRGTPLQMPQLVAAKASPQPALGGQILWQATVTGGAPPLSYEFRLLTEHRLTVVKRGPENQWDWLPRNPGNYQISVKVEDAYGTSTVSPWQPYRIKPGIDRNSRIAVLPIENLSGAKAPLQQISVAYADMLQETGLQLMGTEQLENFMYRHRMRYTGGIGAGISAALRDEDQVAAVMITSLESYEDSVPPKIALISRLVLCQDTPRIAWIDGVGLSGADHPGLLSLGRIDRIEELQKKALATLRASFENYLAGNRPRGNRSEEQPPRDYYRATDFSSENSYRLAIVPFLNRYARKNAGFVIPLHLINSLADHENLDLIEPGLIREQLLKYRLIMQAGPSLAIADALAHKSTLNADLILSGYVFDYQDQSGTPKIDFSTRLFSGPERKIIWWSRSYAAGDDDVYFFDLGRYRSAHVLTEDMSRAIGQLLFPRKYDREPDPTELNPTGYNQH